MKCKVHGYKNHKNCRYCTTWKLWVSDDYIITKRDKKLKWLKNERI